MPVLGEIKEKYPEYTNLAFVVKYHIISIIETVRNMINSVA